MTEDWGFKPAWYGYALSHWKGVGRVELVKDDHPDRLDFYERAWQCFERLGFPIKQLKTYISVHEPETGEGYAEQYPHVHYPLDGMTLVHYLTDSIIPIEIHHEHGIEPHYPFPGLTVIFSNDTKHGVKKNTSGVRRVQLIATALRR